MLVGPGLEGTVEVQLCCLFKIARDVAKYGGLDRRACGKSSVEQEMDSEPLCEHQ